MNYDIELNANDSSVLETQYVFTQGDYGQIQFSIRVKANGVYVTNAQRAYIVFTLSNGYVVTGADMAKSVATYTYPFQGNELQVAGVILAEVKLVYTDGQISSNKFSFICRYDPLHDKSFNAGPYISQLQQFIDEATLKIDYLQMLIDVLQPDVGGTTLTRSDLHNTRDAVTAGIKTIDANMAQNILLRSDVTNQFENDQNKLAGAASVYGLKGTVDTLNSNLTAITPILLTTLGAFLGTVTRNASTISGKQVNVSLTITSPATSIANDIAFFYINKKLKPVVAPILIGNYGVGYVYSSINASNDTVFAARMSAGSIPANTEIYINFNCSIDV